MDKAELIYAWALSCETESSVLARAPILKRYWEGSYMHWKVLTFIERTAIPELPWQSVKRA